MRAFAKPTPIGRLSIEARLVYTTFSVFMLLGYFSSAWLYLDDDLGMRPANTEHYYLGEPDADSISNTDDGPALELPDVPDVAAEALRLKKPARQVMETFHFHLLTMPVCLLIIAHIFMMCGMSTKLKVWTIGIATVSTLVHVVCPPLVRFVSPGFAFLMFPSAMFMGITWIYMTAWPIKEMWIDEPVRA